MRSRAIRHQRSPLTRLFQPHTGEPPPGLYRAARPDLLIHAAGIVLPHFLSALMHLGGDQELPELASAVNRRAMRVMDRRRVAQDADVVQLTLAAPDGTQLPEWHAGEQAARIRQMRRR